MGREPVGMGHQLPEAQVTASREPRSAEEIARWILAEVESAREHGAERTQALVESVACEVSAAMTQAREEGAREALGLAMQECEGEARACDSHNEAAMRLHVPRSARVQHIAAAHVARTCADRIKRIRARGHHG